jgi:GTP-binding protein LepA
MDITKIRNFSIIAHIDHGKSTLADRMLELTHTIEKRKMQDQVLDSMELERERGITIKMQPVRMLFEGYVMNLIDTPGHIDFSYEVSRALKAVEGCILLVDATQGVQAQTLTTLNMAKEAGLTIIPVVSKIDSPLARIDEVKIEIAETLNIDPSTILGVSGKTGEGVLDLLKEIIKRIPGPVKEDKGLQALVFDFQYSNHKGVIVYVRVMNGEVRRHEKLQFTIAERTFLALEVGIFSPEGIPVEVLGAGEIGYIVTGIKEPGIASVGDTIAHERSPLGALPGYMKPIPMVWASIYPESQDDINLLKQSLGKLSLSDSSYTYEEESSGTLGRGFRCGFLGMLHLEIITERLRREFNLELVVTIPSITYVVTLRTGKTETIYSPSLFPDDHLVQDVKEPWVHLKILTPHEYVGKLSTLLYEHEAMSGETLQFGNRTSMHADMPLRELMRGFFDKVKSLTSGYASISYEVGDLLPADVVRMDMLVADDIVIPFTRVVSRRRVEEEAKLAVEKLHKVLPRQMFTLKIQAKSMGRILASESISGMKKNVTQHMYGGDITRKMKLREKQKEGKKKMADIGKVNITHDVYVKMMRIGDE